MAGDPRLEFNDAVRECLASCYRTDLPVAALAEYVEVLKRRDWTATEIHKVEAAVLKILLAVVSKDERDDLVSRMIKPRGDKPAPRAEADTRESTKKSSQKRTNRQDASQRGSDKTRPQENWASGNVLPSQDAFGPGHGAPKRS